MNQLLEERIATTSRGIQYRYYVSKPPSNPPSSTDPVLLLLHGWPDRAALWQYILPTFQRTGLRIFAPDLLGYGGTDKPTTPEAYTFDLQAKDLFELLADAGIPTSQPLLPIGHDWGAAPAQYLYLGHSERCVGLVTLSVPFSPATDTPFSVEAINAATEAIFGYPAFAYWDLFTAPDGADLMTSRLESLWHVLHGKTESWTRKMFCEPGAMRSFLEANRTDVSLRPYAQNEELKQGWIAMMKEGGLAGPCCWYRAARGNLQNEVQKTLPRASDKPYLYIGSDGDPVCRSELIQQPISEGRLGDATVKILNSGHWIPYEKPDEAGEVIVGWMKEKKIF